MNKVMERSKEKIANRNSSKCLLLASSTTSSTCLKDNIWYIRYHQVERTQCCSASPYISGTTYCKYIYYQEKEKGRSLASTEHCHTPLHKTFGEIAKVSMIPNGKSQSILVLQPKTEKLNGAITCNDGS